MLALYTNETVLAATTLVLLLASVIALWVRRRAPLEEPVKPLILSEQERSALVRKQQPNVVGGNQAAPLVGRSAATKARRQARKAAYRAYLRAKRNIS